MSDDLRSFIALITVALAIAAIAITVAVGAPGPVVYVPQPSVPYPRFPRVVRVVGADGECYELDTAGIFNGARRLAMWDCRLTSR